MQKTVLFLLLFLSALGVSFPGNQTPALPLLHADTNLELPLLLSSSDADYDNDELSDDFEITFGLDPEDATGNNGKNGDMDNDGLTNFEESSPFFLTHPNDDLSIPSLDSGFPNLNWDFDGIDVSMMASSYNPASVCTGSCMADLNRDGAVDREDIRVFAKIFGTGSLNDDIQSRGILRVGLEPGYDPFEFYDYGNLVGFDVDIAKELAVYLGVSIEFVPTVWANIIPGLRADKYDIIISGMTRTQAGEEVINFTLPYFTLPDTGDELGIGIKEGELGFLFQVNAFIQTIKANGRYDDIKAVWFP